MGLSVILLKTGAIVTGAPSGMAPTGAAYAPAATDPKKAAIVKSMRFTNTGSGNSKLRAWFVKSGSTFSGAARRILPYDVSLPPGYTLVDELDLTLAPGDGVYLQSDTTDIQFVFSGLERDAV